MKYAFHPVTDSDLVMLETWLREPHVRQWWGDPDHELGVLKQDLQDPLMVMQIVALDDRRFAYVQDYEVFSWPQPHMKDFRPGTRAIDTFIGEPGMTGRGHGARYLRTRAEQLIEDGAPAVLIDPDPDNLQARRAYANAGFVELGEFDTPEGGIMLMQFDAR